MILSIVNTAAPDALHGTLCSGPPPQHFIPYSDKHQGGLRTAQMLSFLLALAGATDGFFAPDASPDAQAAGRRVAVLHAAATALATYAVRFAEKRKSVDAADAPEAKRQSLDGEQLYPPSA